MSTTQRRADALSIGVQAGAPLLLWGPPGVGKSATVEAVVAALRRPCVTVIGSLREASDFAGLPVRTDAGVRFVPPAWAEQAAADPRTVIFLDELTSAPPSVQAAMLRLVLDRRIGDLVLPDSVAIVAAANPPEVAADGFGLAPPLANRFCHLHWTIEPAAWVDGMTAGWPDVEVARLPADWCAGVPRWRALVASFIRARPTLLLDVPDDSERGGGAWPSPRSWDLAARLAAATDAADVGETALLELVTGCVGHGAAIELLVWVAELDLPDPEDLLADPTSADLPERGDRLHAVLASVVAAVSGDRSRGRWEAAWEVLARVVDAGGADVAAVAARSLASMRDPSWPAPFALDAFLPLLRSAGLVDG